MPKYIDAENFERHFLGEMKRFPAADVREVKRGEWIKSNTYEGYLACSNCDMWVISEAWTDDMRLKFCPECGADMRGDGDK